MIDEAKFESLIRKKQKRVLDCSSLSEYHCEDFSSILARSTGRFIGSICASLVLGYSSEVTAMVRSRFLVALREMRKTVSIHPAFLSFGFSYPLPRY